MKLTNVLKDCAYKFKFKRIKNHFTRFFLDRNVHYESDETPFFEHFVYKDERWNYIANLYEYRKSIGRGNAITFEDNVCDGNDKYKIEGKELVVDAKRKKENWLCFYYENELTCQYEFSFDIKITSVFKEIQIAFRYHDLGNRLRFIIRNNSEAAFECVSGGEFYNHIYSKGFSLSVGRYHRICVTVCETQYFLSIDDEVVFAIQGQEHGMVLGNKICFILYNPDDGVNIQCRIRNAKIKTGN